MLAAGILMLKSLRPEKYKDRQMVQLDLKDWDGDISRLSDEQLEKFLIEIEKRAQLQAAQQQAALPPASEAVIEATAEEIPTAD
jgi:hypothetical protein